MSGGTVFVFFGAFFALAIVMLVLGLVQAKKRREAFGLLAAQRGWTYVERDDHWTTVFDDAPFGLGHNRRAGNVLSGRYDGRAFIAFDYVYDTTERSTDSNGHTRTREVSHTFGIVGIDLVDELGSRPFPTLRVTPEGIFARMIGRLTNRDIELESEDFNRAFTVTSEERKFASDILHPRMMEYLLQRPEAQFRFDRRWILNVETSSPEVEEVESRLQYLDGILDQVPAFVWQEYGGVER